VRPDSCCPYRQPSAAPPGAPDPCQLPSTGAKSGSLWQPENARRCSRPDEKQQKGASSAVLVHINSGHLKVPTKRPATAGGIPPSRALRAAARHAAAATSPAKRRNVARLPDLGSETTVALQQTATAPFEVGPTISPVSPNIAASFVGLCPTTRARPPSGRASSTRPSAAPNAAESASTNSGSAARIASSAPLPAFSYASRQRSSLSERKPASTTTPPGDTLAQRGEKARERLGRTLRARRNKQVVAAVQARTDLRRRAHTLLRQYIPISIRVPSQLDVSRHFHTLIAADPRRKTPGVPLDACQDDDN
jgi:hypothetical protein